ncbi:hypothetical protein CB1_001499008 [Camelus ferus]|nr:hypothetical protein CB1_001499008 [Camelus ferus]
MTDLGRLGAFITKVKKGSLADVVGHLRAGDEVLEWNGKPLPGATNEEVYNIILESKSEPQVEIIVSRPIGDIPRIPESSHPPLESRSQRISDSDISDYEADDGIGVVPPAKDTVFLPSLVVTLMWREGGHHDLQDSGVVVLPGQSRSGE